MSGDRRIRIAVFVLALAVAAASTGGRALANVDTAFYTRLSDGILRGDLGEIFSSLALNWTTLVIVSLIAASRAISPDHWMALVVSVNVLCFALTAVLLFTLVRRVTRSALASVAALVLYLGCYEVLIWIRFVLTDTIYATVALFVFLLVVDGILDVDRKRRRALLAGGMVVAMFTRVVGLVLIPLTIFAELVLRRPPQERPRWLRGGRLLLLLGVTVAAAYYVRAYIVQDPRRWPVDFIRPAITAYFEREQQMGEVIWDRPETYRRPLPTTVNDYVLLELDRSARFYQFLSPTFSRAHNFINAAYYIPLYVLVVIGAVAGMRSADWRRRTVTRAALLWLAAYTVFHGLTLVDFDWRYRVQLMPQLILLAAVAIDALARAIGTRMRA